MVQVSRPVASRPWGLVSVLAVLAVAAVVCGYSLLQIHWPLHSVASSLLTPLLPLPPLLLLSWRLVVTLISFYTLAVIYLDNHPFEVRYFGSTFHLVRAGRWSTFTVQNFTLITLYFSMVSLLSLSQFFGWPLSDKLALGAVLLFRIIYPLAILVTAVVTFVLYPAAVQLGMEPQIERMFQWPALVMHNANVVFLLIEMILFAPGDFFTDHRLICMPILYGIFYGLFACFWFWKTGVFYYFFLDWRRDYAAVVYVILLMACASFYLVELATRFAVRNNLWFFVLLICFFTAYICRLRDARIRT